MISVIYQFKVKPNQTEKFIEAWREMTELIYEYEGSLGSRLHKKDEQIYIAYAQWPDQDTWGNAGHKLPEKANEVRARMRAACEDIETLFELEMVEDLLQSKQW